MASFWTVEEVDLAHDMKVRGGVGVLLPLLRPAADRSSKPTPCPFSHHTHALLTHDEMPVLTVIMAL